MKPTNLVIAALLLAPLAALHAQTVPLKLRDFGRRVEIDRSALLRIRHQGPAAAIQVSTHRNGGERNAGDPFQAENEMTLRSADTTHHTPPRCP